MSIFARIAAVLRDQPPADAIASGLTCHRVGRTWVVSGVGGETFQGRARRAPDDLDRRVCAAWAAAELSAMPESRSRSRRGPLGETPPLPVFNYAQQIHHQQ